jgi:beta-lactamase regulating signal transducer with metallopeptidase domain
VREEAVTSLLLALWLAGTLACWSMAALRLGRLSRLLRTVPPVTAELAQRIDRLSAQLGLKQRPRAYLVPGVMPPMLLVLGRSSQLLLPATLWERLDSTQRDTLLLHELAHLRRADHRVRWLELVVLGLYWWHPVAWWACRALRDAEEACCDAWVLWAAPEAGPAYAATLVETVAYLSGAPAALPAGASGAGPVRLIKRRLTMILRGSTPRRLSRPALAGMLLLGLVLLPLVPTLAQPAPEKPSADQRESEPAPRPVIDRSASMDAHNPVLLALSRVEKRGCQACHVAQHSTEKKVRVDKLHDEIVQLMDEVARHRDQLMKAEAKLKDALKRFEAQQAKKVPPLPRAPGSKLPADRRLEDVEKKLEQLLKEVEKLRKDLRPSRGSSSSSGRSNLQYINMREFELPVSWDPRVARG